MNLNLNLVEIITVAITLFAVIDMLGNIPLIINLRKQHGEIESLKGTIVSVLIMIGMLFFGKALFNLIGIETYHFALVGSLLILYFGKNMVLGITHTPKGDRKTQEKLMKATIFPIAFPLISGPGTLSTIISLRADFSDINIVIGILLNSIVIFIVLKTASWIERKIGETGITLIERIFGIILLAIGIKMFIFNLILSINDVINIGI